jgi:hypothetical protein
MSKRGDVPWWVTADRPTASEVTLDLNKIADQTNEAHDHDELHAAADVVRLGVSSPYIDRWIAGLIKLHDTPNQR